MAEDQSAAEPAGSASAAHKNRERSRRRYQALRNEPAFLEVNRQRARARRANFGRSKRTPEQRAREREFERKRYAELKDDPEHVAKRRAIRRERHARNPEKKRSYDRQWLAANKDNPDVRARLRASQKAHYSRHPEVCVERNCKKRLKRLSSEVQREHTRRYDKARYVRIKDNPEFKIHNREKQKSWKLKNSGRVSEYRRAYVRKNPSFRMLEALRSRMRSVVKRAASKKSDRTVALIGCSLNHLRQHLESMFRDGMTWENYGRVWHVDHKRPCRSFDMSDPKQQAECFSWTNLQPLLAAENLTKAASM